MLRGGFNWIFAGFVIDIVLEWKPAFLSYIQDERLLGWINMVPNDVIYLVRACLAETFSYCSALLRYMA